MNIFLLCIFILMIFSSLSCATVLRWQCACKKYVVNGKTNERRSIYLYLVFFHFQHICTHILITTDNKLLNRERESLPKIDRKSIYSLFDNNNLVSSSLSLEIESYAEKRSCPFSLETKYSLFSWEIILPKLDLNNHCILMKDRNLIFCLIKGQFL